MSTADTSGEAAEQAPGEQVRYVLPGVDELNPEQADLVARIVGGPRAQQAGLVPLTDVGGRLAGVFSLMPIAPAVGDRVQALGAALRFDVSLSPLTRELAILAVAVHRLSDFEWFAHERAAIDAGATSAQLNAIKRAEIPDGLPEPTAVALAILAELLRDGALGEQSYATALETLGADGLAELVWLQGYYAMLATALAAFRPPLPSGAHGMLTGPGSAEPDISDPEDGG